VTSNNITGASFRGHEANLTVPPNSGSPPFSAVPLVRSSKRKTNWYRIRASCIDQAYVVVLGTQSDLLFHQQLSFKVRRVELNRREKRPEAPRWSGQGHRRSLSECRPNEMNGSDQTSSSESRGKNQIDSVSGVLFTHFTSVAFIFGDDVCGAAKNRHGQVRIPMGHSAHVKGDAH
jgi:hypothetical protein